MQSVRSTGNKEKIDAEVANDAADKAANWGRELHERADQALEKEVKILYWHATVTCRVIAKLMPMWPRLERDKLRTGLKSLSDSLSYVSE